MGWCRRSQAEDAYGVVLTPTKTADLAATATRRSAAKEERGAPQPFDFGYTPPVREAAE